MKTIVVLFSFIFSFASLTHANRIGNGGNYVICNRNRTFSYFYDYYELVRIKKQKVIEAKSSGDAFKRAKAILFRQSGKNSAFNAKISSYIDHMSSSMDDMSNDLVFLHDNPDYVLEQHCEIAQAAISGPEKDGRWHYSISYDAWTYLDRMNAATLVLHEVIYRLGFERGQLTSLNTKILVQALLTSDENSDPNKISGLRKSLGFTVAGE